MAKTARKIVPSPDKKNVKNEIKNIGQKVGGRIMKNKAKKQPKFKTEKNESINDDNVVVLEPVRRSDDLPLSLVRI